ncbi:hypothetical protein NE865_02582 [Phthorimaea operculella]|nr:hypothetical protein NE865_02582 [Phthorimaea operculella]
MIHICFQVVESYTIGREQFGMEKEFIVEVVQNCPNPACRYYKNQLEMTQKSIQQHLSQQPTYIPGNPLCLPNMNHSGNLTQELQCYRIIANCCGITQQIQINWKTNCICDVLKCLTTKVI